MKIQYMLAIKNYLMLSINFKIVCVIVIVLCNFCFLQVTNDVRVMAHIKRVNQFQCRYPQPRVFNSLDILKGSVTVGSAQILLPAFTVLSVCENSGCCSDTGQTCTYDEIEEVTLYYSLTTTNSSKPIQTSEIVHVQRTNHTSCKCAFTDDLITAERNVITKT